MATYKVYKFRGQDFHGFYSVRLQPRDGSLPRFFDDADTPNPLEFVWPVRFSVVGDVYFAEDFERDGLDIHLYLLSCYFHAFLRRYGYDAAGTFPGFPQMIWVSDPPVDSKVESSVYVEPTLGNTEVVYRRCRLDGAGTLNFYLSHSPEVAPGEYNLGSLVRPAPRTLFSEEVAEKFRTSDSGGPCDCK